MPPLVISLKNCSKNVDRESTLYLPTDINELVQNIIQTAPGQNTEPSDEKFYHYIFANAIFNYLGKWCNDTKNANAKVQINLALIEEAVTKRFKATETIKCPLYADEVLATKFLHLLEQEQAILTTIGTKQWGSYAFEQMDDPENNRSVIPLNEEASRFEKWHPMHRTWYTRTPKDTPRTAPKVGTLHSKKRSCSLPPSDLTYVKLFQEVGGNQRGDHERIALLFDIDEVYHKHEKYSFPEGASTNNQWQYKTTGFGYELYKVYGKSVGFNTLRKNNQKAVAAKEEIACNEIRAGIPKRCLRGVVAINDSLTNRITALKAVYHAKNKFALDYDIPLFIKSNTAKNGIHFYSHDQRLLDICEWIKQHGYTNDEEIWIKPALISSYPRVKETTKNTVLQSQLSNVLKTLSNQKIITQNILNSSSVLIKPLLFQLADYENIDNHVDEKVLSGLAIVTIAPLVGFGLYKMIDEILEIPSDDLEKILPAAGITALATLTVIPLLCYGFYHAVLLLSKPPMLSNPETMKITEDNPEIEPIKFSLR